MLQSKQDRDYIHLAKDNPMLFELVNIFDLVNENREELPDIKALENIKFSLFWRNGDNTKNTTPRKEINFEELIKIIKSPWLKSIPKKERPYITPYGTFSIRNNEGLKQMNNNLVALDYDKLTPEKLNYLQLYWECQTNTILCLVSPSGNGLKVLIRAIHSFTKETLYSGLKLNCEPFVVSGIKPDLMQFVLSQPMFIPYSENPYFNPYAIGKDYGFKEPEQITIEPIKFNKINMEDYTNLNRINSFFIKRVEMYLSNLESRPKEQGTHQYLFSTLKRIYPYINQQTTITESEITSRIESIIINKYGNTSEVKALHRSIEKAKYPELSIIDLINQTAKFKLTNNIAIND